MVIAINNSKKGGMDRNGNIMHVEYVEYWWWQYHVTGMITILACYNECKITIHMLWCINCNLLLITER